VAIKHTQQGPRLKLANKYLDYYKIIKILHNNRYVIRKIDDHEDTWETSTVADYMKPWASEIDNPSSNKEPYDLDSEYNNNGEISGADINE